MNVATQNSKIFRFRPYPDYKNSGVEWLGEIPAHWNVTPIRALAKHGYKTFTDGDWIESPFIRNQGIRLIQTGNIGIGVYEEQGFRYIDEETFRVFRCTEIKPKDVLICRLAEPVGRACLAPDLGCPMITSVDVCILKTAGDIDPAYVVYALSGTGYLSWLSAICRGGTRDRVSRSMLGAIRVQKPPHKEQRAIGAFLDRKTAEIDALIMKKERLIELLQEKRAALVTQVILKGSDANTEMKDSGIEWLGQIPSHWRIKKVKTIFREFDSRSVTGEEELLTVSHITGVTRRSEKNVNMFEAETTEGYRLCRAGDLVINTLWAWMGALGVAWETGIVSPAYNVYRQRDKFYLPKYLELLSRVAPLLTELKRYSKGVWSSRLRLYPEEFFQIHLPVPPIEEQERILMSVEKTLQNGDVLVGKVQEGIDRLKEYRSALISAVVTGKIDVRNEVAEAT